MKKSNMHFTTLPNYNASENIAGYIKNYSGDISASTQVVLQNMQDAMIEAARSSSSERLDQLRTFSYFKNAILENIADKNERELALRAYNEAIDSLRKTTMSLDTLVGKFEQRIGDIIGFATSMFSDLPPVFTFLATRGGDFISSQLEKRRTIKERHEALEREMYAVSDDEEEQKEKRSEKPKEQSNILENGNHQGSDVATDTLNVTAKSIVFGDEAKKLFGFSGEQKTETGLIIPPELTEPRKIEIVEDTTNNPVKHEDLKQENSKVEQEKQKRGFFGKLKDNAVGIGRATLVLSLVASGIAAWLTDLNDKKKTITQFIFENPVKFAAGLTATIAAVTIAIGGVTGLFMLMGAVIKGTIAALKFFKNSLSRLLLGAPVSSNVTSGLDLGPDTPDGKDKDGKNKPNNNKPKPKSKPARAFNAIKNFGGTLWNGITSTGGKILTAGTGLATAGFDAVSKAAPGIKTVAGTVAKTGLKGALRAIPGIGAVVGAGFAIDRLIQGDGLGALMEFSSGLASLLPGIGTAASVALTAGLAARDISKDLENSTTTLEAKDKLATQSEYLSAQQDAIDMKKASQINNTANTTNVYNTTYNTNNTSQGKTQFVDISNPDNMLALGIR